MLATNPDHRLVARPAQGPRLAAPWCVVRVPCAGGRVCVCVDLVPRVCDLVARITNPGPRSWTRWPWTGRAGDLLALLVRLETLVVQDQSVRQVQHYACATKYVCIDRATK